MAKGNPIWQPQIVRGDQLWRGTMYGVTGEQIYQSSPFISANFVPGRTNFRGVQIKHNSLPRQSTIGQFSPLQVI